MICSATFYLKSGATVTGNINANSDKKIAEEELRFLQTTLNTAI